MHCSGGSKSWMRALLFRKENIWKPRFESLVSFFSNPQQVAERASGKLRGPQGADGFPHHFHLEAVSSCRSLQLKHRLFLFSRESLLQQLGLAQSRGERGSPRAAVIKSGSIATC
jgi:hypothetical protein